MIENLERAFRDLLMTLEAMLRDQQEELERATGLVQGVLASGHKVLLFGNGGSAAQAQHIAAELVNRLRHDRAALPALALTTDTSVLTSVANDRDFSKIFSRQIEALGRPGDLAWGLTTSGRSPNVLEGLREARQRGLKTMVFSGGKGGEAKGLADVALVVPSTDVPRIQEIHLLLGHVICEVVEARLREGN